MMPVVRTSDATFAGLKTLSAWLGTKTPSETVERVVQDMMDQLGLERDDEPEEGVSALGEDVMDFSAAPGLTFTKPLKATVGGKAVPNPRWSSILLAIIGQVKAKGPEGEELSNELGVQSKATRYEQEGYRYYDDLGISVQGQPAADAWKEIERLARKWRIPVSVEFMWRQNPKAQYPGKTGRLKSGSQQ